MIIHDTVTVVIERQGRFLLIKKAKNRVDKGEWAFPGGHLDKDESPLEAVKRETREEIGNAEILENEPFTVFVHKVDKSIIGKHKHNCHVFKGRVSGKLKAGDDAAQIKWFSKQEIINNKKVQGFTKYIVKRFY
jgi:ADP-ribose pyrophosphatase YjhB (NUDIX family)